LISKHDIMVINSNNYAPLFPYGIEVIIERVREDSGLPCKCINKFGRVTFCRKEDLRVCMMPSRDIMEKLVEIQCN